MKMRFVFFGIALGVLGAAGAAQAFTESLYSSSSAGACGGSASCVLNQSQTLDPAAPGDHLSTSAANSLLDGSYADAFSQVTFGLQRVYTDAFRAAGPTSGDAQANAMANFIDISVAKAVDSTFGFTFAITGTRTSTDTVYGAAAVGYLYYRLTELHSYGASKSGQWIASDAMPGGVITDSFFVPAFEQMRLEVEFQASAYTNNNDLPGPTLAVVSDYSHTVHTYVTSDTGAVEFQSGHDYAAPSTVPEPTTWALMLGGFGLAGGCLRRRHSFFRRTGTAAVSG